MKKKDDTLSIPKQDKEKSIQILKKYLEENFEVEAGNLQIEILLDYISEKFGKYYYNRGVEDSMSVMTEKIEDLYLIMKE